MDNVALTTVDVQSPQSIEAWAAEVASLTPHVDVSNCISFLWLCCSRALLLEGGSSGEWPWWRSSDGEMLPASGWAGSCASLPGPVLGSSLP